jgi:hypothetical protein
LLNIETFINELLKLTVAIGDDHTRVEPLHQTVVPVRFKMFIEGIFVVGIDNLYYDLLLSKVIAVNKIP